MNQVKRTGIFETNSSSTHSITIEGGEYIPDMLDITSWGTVVIYPGEFGWDECTYRDAITKASYALTWIKCMESSYDATPKQVQTWSDMLKKVILDTDDQAKEVAFEKSTSKYHEWGYIDHQSIEGDGGVGAEAFESEKNLRDFIFNRKSVLITDNDNHE